MKLVIDTYRGTNINDGTNWVSDFPDNMPLVAPTSSVVVELLDTPSQNVGRRHVGPTLTLFVQPQANYRSQRETLRELFKTEEQYQFYTLTAHDEDDSDRSWSIDIAPLNVSPMKDGFIIIAATKKYYWVASAVTGTQTYTASGQTKNYTVNTPTPHKVKPVITITIGGPKSSSYLYEVWVPVKNPGNSTGVVPFDFGNSIDTAALVLAGKMQSTGYDCRLQINGYEVPRWLDGFNTADTKVWANIVFPAIKPLPLRTAISNVGTPTSIDFKSTADMALIFSKWASSGELVINNEGFRYTAKDTKNMKVTGITRQLKNTAAASHSIGDNAYLQPFDVRLVYGNPAATDPAYPDTTKPTLDLTASSNLSHVFTTFGANSGLRFPSWSYNRAKGSSIDTKVYNGVHIDQADPFDVLGLTAAAYFSGGAWRADTIILSCLYSSPWRVTSFTIDGDKYRHTASWTISKVWVGKTPTTLVAKYTIPTPSVIDTWQTWTYSSGALTGDQYHIKLDMTGSVGASADNVCAVEANDFTANFNSADVPTCFHAPESSTYQFDMTMSNSLTGASMQIVKNMSSVQTLVIDCENRTVKVDGLDSSAGVTPADDFNWFDMESGVNPITLVDAGMSDITVAITGNAQRGV